MKVYCKDCKFYWHTRETDESDYKRIYTYYCDPLEFYEPDEYNLYEDGKMFVCKEQNKSNKCKYYKKLKWWEKFLGF